MPYKALLIGTSSYRDLPLIRGTDADLQLLTSALLSGGGRSWFTREHVSVVPDPTLIEVKAELLQFLRRAEPGDNLLIYMSGHSAVERDELYLLFTDANSWSPTSSALPSSDVSSALAQTLASSVLVLLNVSFAGSFKLPDSPRLKDSESSYFFIGSVGPTEPASEDNAFAQAVAAGLGQAMGPNGDLDPELLFATISDRSRPGSGHPFYAARGHRLSEPRQPAPTDPLSVFVSYSHKDKRWLSKLRPHLESLALDVVTIDYWDDTKVMPGDDWHDQIRRRVTTARAAVLLVSADFLTSNFVRNEELPALIAQAEGRRTRLFCLIIRPCRFDKMAVLARFQAVNSPDKTLSEMPLSDQERIFVRLTDQLEQALR